MKIRYVYNDSRTPVATIATELNKTNDILEVALARCHSNMDIFVKKRGRHIAASRLKKRDAECEFSRDFPSTSLKCLFEGHVIECRRDDFYLLKNQIEILVLDKSKRIQMLKKG